MGEAHSRHSTNFPLDWVPTNLIRRKRSHGAQGFAFVVTLSRYKGGDKETVRMEPHPPYYRPNALEARHWGATYALYRVGLRFFTPILHRRFLTSVIQQFCNGIQLNRVLPPGPRDYWNDLASEHRNVEEHRKWMYESDPFDAKKEVERRQAAAQKAREAPTSGSQLGEIPKPNSKGSSGYPEVVMATSLRELVEDAIKEV